MDYAKLLEERINLNE